MTGAVVMATSGALKTQNERSMYIAKNGIYFVTAKCTNLTDYFMQDVKLL